MKTIGKFFWSVTKIGDMISDLKFSFSEKATKMCTIEIYLVNVKTMRTIAQIFVAFSEKLSFT